MNLTITKKQISKSILRHLVIWIIWQTINSLRLISIWDEVPKLPLLYNYLSLVILYYPIHYCALGYWDKISNFYKEKRTLVQKAFYLLFRWRAVAVIFFIGIYIMGSWLVDRYLFHIMYDNFALYCDGRWTRASTYVFVAIGYSYIKYIKAKYKMKMEAADIKIIILKEHIAKNHITKDKKYQELIRRVDAYTSR
jgi:hypothetical protein